VFQMSVCIALKIVMLDTQCWTHLLCCCMLDVAVFRPMCASDDTDQQCVCVVCVCVVCVFLCMCVMCA